LAGGALTGSMSAPGISTQSMVSPQLQINKSGNAASGISWYTTGWTAWAEYMANSGTGGNGPYGNITAPAGGIVTTWALRSAIESVAGYGWTWESGSTTGQPSVVMELRSSDGLLRPLGGITLPAGKRAVFENNPTWGAQLVVGGDGINGITRSATVASVVTTNGNLHLDCGDASRGVHLNYYSGGYVVFGNGASNISASMDSAGQLWKGAATGSGDRYVTVGQNQHWTGQQFFQSNMGSASEYLSNHISPPLMASSSDQGPAFMSFHRENAYAVNMGLDPDNVFRIGGWSAPANLFQLWMDGKVTVNVANNNSGNWNEGIRVTSANNGYSCLVLGTDTSGAGSITGQWGIAKRPDNVLAFNSWVGTTLTMDSGGNGAFSGFLSAARLYAGWDAGVTGSISTNNWFRTSGGSGLYFADVGWGLYSAQGDYGNVGTFGTGRNGWSGFSINGGPVFMHNNSSSGSWGIYNDYSNVWMLNSDMSGNATFAGNVTAYSDRRIKKDIKPIKGALRDLLKIVGVSFTRIDSGEPGIGVIAQDVQAVYPHAVTESFKDAERKQGILTVAYGNLVGPIIEAIRELTERLDALEAA